MRALKEKKGFTLIELVIVLAIAALILAGVILAVGGAQRTQRDQARKNLAGRLSTAMENFASNNNGSYTGFACTAAAYCNGIEDPDTGTQPTSAGGAGAVTGPTTGMRWTVGQGCDSVANTRRYRVDFWVENATARQCIDNR